MLKMTSDAPVRLVTYPGEGHGNRMAAAQYDYGHRVLRWMQHYLQGEGGQPPAADLPMAEMLGLEDSGPRTTLNKKGRPAGLPFLLGIEACVGP
jgi:hypothetical protein